jgi:hypothetical protein
MDPPGVPNWEALQRGLYEEARLDVDQALKVALLIQHEVPQQQIADRLGVSIADVKLSIKRLRRIANRIDFETEAEHE